MIDARLRAALALGLLIGIAAFLSTDRKRIAWRLVAWGVGLQVVFALLVLRTPQGAAIFDVLDGVVHSVLGYGNEASAFVFGNLVQNEVPVGTLDESGGFVDSGETFARPGAFFAFRILPNIIFVSALMTVLYHVGFMQRVVWGVAWVMRRTMKTSGAETLCTASNIFVGMMESPLVVKPYVERMTTSELMAIMTAGLATISANVLAAYAGMLSDVAPGATTHLIAASVMSAPAALVVAKILVPETEVPETTELVEDAVERPDVNIIDAAARGASEGLRLALLVGAMIIAFLALVAMFNGAIGWVGGWFGQPDVTLQGLLGAAFRPVAWMLGIPWTDAALIGQMIGVDLVLNEFVAYVQLTDALVAGAAIEPRSVVIGIYALTTFANFGSVAMTIAGIGAIAPSRRPELATLGMKALLAGLMASLMTAAIAGVLV
ncbi:MAG: nucleoside transporter C-terminal domain-containing protein [Gemmatimonadota bacterium]